MKKDPSVNKHHVSRYAALSPFFPEPSLPKQPHGPWNCTQHGYGDTFVQLASTFTDVIIWKEDLYKHFFHKKPIPASQGG